jgi:hypothetical protein
MGSSNNNIISQLKAAMQELRQGFSGMRQEMSGFFSVTNAASSMVGGHSNAVHTNQVAPNPVFNNAPSIIGMTESGNIVAAGPSASMTAGSGFSQQAIPGMENLGQFVGKNPGSGTIYTPASMSGTGGGAAGVVNQTSSTDPTNATGKALDTAIGFLKGTAGILSGLGIASSFLPGTDEIVQTNLLMKRIGFFGGNNSSSSLKGLAEKGTVTSSLDALNALVAGQSMGLGSGNEKFNTGVANVSNLTPGMGVEGAMRATGAMQQASSVNMLRGIGIQLRDANGNMAAPDKVIDDVWDKICKDYKQAYGSARNNGEPSLDEVQIALQPGNSLDSMLNQYFGGDPMLKNMVMNGLLYRAKPGTSALASGVSKGVTSTEAITALSNKYSTTTGVLTSISDTGAKGFISATNIIAGLIDDFAGVAKKTIRLKTFMDTMLSAAGGAPTEAISGTASLLSLFKADGGPVQGGAAYIVGERGPELFVPGVSGAIVPNDQIQPNQNKNSGTITGSSNNTYNFNINIPNANTPEVIGALRKLMSDLETNKIVSES